MIDAVKAFSKVLSIFCAMRPAGDSEAMQRTAISVSGKVAAPQAMKKKNRFSTLIATASR